MATTQVAPGCPWECHAKLKMKRTALSQVSTWLDIHRNPTLCSLCVILGCRSLRYMSNKTGDPAPPCLQTRAIVGSLSHSIKDIKVPLYCHKRDPEAQSIAQESELCHQRSYHTFGDSIAIFMVRVLYVLYSSNILRSL